MHITLTGHTLLKTPDYCDITLVGEQLAGTDRNISDVHMQLHLIGSQECAAYSADLHKHKHTHTHTYVYKPSKYLTLT